MRRLIDSKQKLIYNKGGKQIEGLATLINLINRFLERGKTNERN